MKFIKFSYCIILSINFSCSAQVVNNTITHKQAIDSLKIYFYQFSLNNDTSYIIKANDLIKNLDVTNKSRYKTLITNFKLQVNFILNKYDDSLLLLDSLRSRNVYEVDEFEFMECYFSLKKYKVNKDKVRFEIIFSNYIEKIINILSDNSTYYERQILSIRYYFLLYDEFQSRGKFDNAKNLLVNKFSKLKNIIDEEVIQYNKAPNKN